MICLTNPCHDFGGLFEINCTSTDNGSTDSIYVYIYIRVHVT